MLWVKIPNTVYSAKAAKKASVRAFVPKDER